MIKQRCYRSEDKRNRKILPRRNNSNSTILRIYPALSTVIFSTTDINQVITTTTITRNSSSSSNDSLQMGKFDSHLSWKKFLPLLTITIITGASIKERTRPWVERVNQFTSNIYRIPFLVVFLLIHLVVQLAVHLLDGKVNFLISLDSIVLAITNITSLMRTSTRLWANCKNSAKESEKSNENQSTTRILLHYPPN